MLRVSLPTTLALVALALGLCACDGRPRNGNSSVSEPCPSGESLGPEWGVLTRSYVAVEPPLVQHARWDRPSEWRLVLNLLENGDVIYVGRVRPFASAEAHEREVARERLRADLDQLCSDPEAREADGSCRLPLMLHADRWVRWDHVRDVLRTALGEGRRFSRLFWSVQAPATYHRLRQEASIEAPSVPASEEAQRIDLSGRWMDEYRIASELTMRIGSEAWTETQTHDHRAGPGASLHLWSSAEPHLSAKTVELSIAEPANGIYWGHVAVLLDHLLASGVREVSLPQLGVRLKLAEPEDLSLDPFVREDDPVFTPLVVTLSAIAALLAAALTFAPLRGLARRPRRNRRA